MMGWTNEQPTEITAPGGVPFEPGNDVVGIGTELPPELTALGYTNAIVFYSTGWNPAATVPTTKFWFVCTVGGSVITGFGYCPNPSVSTVAIVRTSHGEGLLVGSSTYVNFELYDIDGHSMWQWANANSPYMLMRDATGVIRASLRYDTTGTVVFELGSNVFAQGNTNAYTSVSQPLVRDTSWSGLPLVNGWVSDGARPAQYRLMPDGTVTLRGHATSPGNPANGAQVWGALPVAYRPVGLQEYLCACGTRPYNGAQKVAVQTDGTGLGWDMAALSGDVVLSSIRWAVL